MDVTECYYGGRTKELIEVLGYRNCSEWLMQLKLETNTDIRENVLR